MWGNRHARARRSTAVATLAIVGLGLMAGLAPAALAQESDDAPPAESNGRPHRPRLTDEQRACLQEQGLEKPAKDENGERVKPTEEQRAAFRAAAEACGIQLPPGRIVRGSPTSRRPASRSRGSRSRPRTRTASV